MTKMNKRRKAIAVGAAGVLAASGLGGVFAAWTDSVSTEAQNLSTGSGTISITDGDLVATADSSVSDIVPGDVITRDITIQSDTTYALKNLVMSVEATGSSLLLDGEDAAGDPTPSNGKLQAVVSDDEGHTLFTGDAKDMAFDSNDLQLLAGGGADTKFTVAITFPASATNEYKGQAASFDYTFTATQRDGVQR